MITTIMFAVLGAVLAACGISVLSSPFQFFAILITAILIALFARAGK